MGLCSASWTSGNSLVWLDPIKNVASEIKIPSQAEPLGSMEMPSPYWGEENIWLAAAQPRSAAVDQAGRVWFASRNRGGSISSDGGQTTRLLQGGSQQQVCPVLSHGTWQQTGRGVRSGEEEISEIDTCFTTDHNEFGADGSLFFGQNGFSRMGQYCGVGQNPQ